MANSSMVPLDMEKPLTCLQKIKTLVKNCKRRTKNDVECIPKNGGGRGRAQRRRVVGQLTGEASGKAVSATGNLAPAQSKKKAQISVREEGFAKKNNPQRAAAIMKEASVAPSTVPAEI